MAAVLEQDMTPPSDATAWEKTLKSKPLSNEKGFVPIRNLYSALEVFNELVAVRTQLWTMELAHQGCLNG